MFFLAFDGPSVPLRQFKPCGRNDRVTWPGNVGVGNSAAIAIHPMSFFVVYNLQSELASLF